MMPVDLTKRHCKPCEGGVLPLNVDQRDELKKSLHDDWLISDDGLRIEREFRFLTYSHTLGFTNAVAWVATIEGHHPQISFSYGSCVVSFTTHSINGLSDNDFICAAKIDRLHLI
ncbi:MAG: pterin-4-alpha-carbinolamine dehydratase [Woeseia sp.]|nr:pterin-4-alpha-carbinolamine dehydratase [Woeseia sp.]